MNVTLMPLEENDREQFILDNQEAFRYGAIEGFGLPDFHFDEGEIISIETIERAIDEGQAFRIIADGEKAGGMVVHVLEEVGVLDILFVKPLAHNKGIGYSAWSQMEKMYPEIKVWETVTPYFEKRNIHFYVNRCGFHIVEFFNRFHPDPNDPHELCDDEAEEFDGMFKFRKEIL